MNIFTHSGNSDCFSTKELNLPCTASMVDANLALALFVLSLEQASSGRQWLPESERKNKFNLFSVTHTQFKQLTLNLGSPLEGRREGGIEGLRDNERAWVIYSTYIFN